MTSHPHLLYPEFVEKGVAAGRRLELTGGGLVRSAGGRSALRPCATARAGWRAMRWKLF